MIEHQIHFGRVFYQDKKKGYWISTDYPRIRAHRWVWLQIHGIIPKGYHIHHKNDDKSDNRIENLELIERSRHLSHHMQDPVRKQKAREMADEYRHLTKEWHKSEEGREWHRLHALKNDFGNGPSFDYSCQQCGKDYQSKLVAEGRTRFCSNACKSRWRRAQKLDDVDKICPICQKTYRINRYRKTKTCSRVCGKKIT